MQAQWLHIMRTPDSNSVQFSITLPVRAIELLERAALTGLYGGTRAEVARILIMNRLEELVGKGIVNLPRD
jgi:hypothetical protein